MDKIKKGKTPKKSAPLTDDELEKQAALPKKSNKKIYIALGVLVVLIIVVGIIFINEGKEKTPKTKEQERTEFKAKTGYDERLRETIQDNYYVNNKGTIYKGYQFNEDYYLTLNQSGVFKYDKKYPGDILLWVKESKGKVETRQISTGDKLLSVIEDGGSPYLKQDGHTYFVYYEKEGNDEIGYVANGYVYEVKKDGTLKKQYETKGHFYSLKKNTEGKLLLTEKVFVNSRNMYPMDLKPYKLKTYQLDNNEWSLIGEKMVSPADEQVKEKKSK